jgi:hypothetical protein
MEGIRHLPPLESPKQNPERSQEAISRVLEVLEKGSQNNEEIHVLEEAITSTPDALYKIYDAVAKKHKAFLGALVFAVASQVGIAPQHTEKMTLPISQSQSSGTTEGERTKSIDTASLLKDAKEIERDAIFYFAEKTTPRTIVHLGQSHDSSVEENYRSRYEIVKSQTEIAIFLLKSATPDTSVFVEGYVPGNRDELNFRKEMYINIGKAQTIADLEKVYIQAYNNDESSERSKAILNEITNTQLIAFGFKETSSLTYTSQFGEIFQLLPTGFFPSDKNYTESNYIESSIGGGATALGAKGIIDIQPAETLDGNSKSYRLRDALDKKGRSLEKFFISSLEKTGSYNEYIKENILPSISKYPAKTIESVAQSDLCRKNIECQGLTRELLVDTDNIEKAVMDDREDIAVERIAEYSKISTQNKFPLVFGNAHDFTRAVTKWNKAHPEYQFNLVTIKKSK